jgi:Zn finger protein HypA/HybF involved in hydrogenase expression
MSVDRATLLAAMDAIGKGEPAPEGVFMHVSHTPTQADWDALDPNSYETECRDCGVYYEGQFEPKPEETYITCPECGSANHGCVGSPAGSYSLAMRSDF